MLNPENLTGAFIVLIILTLAGMGVYKSLKYSGQLSPVADSYS